MTDHCTAQNLCVPAKRQTQRSTELLILKNLVKSDQKPLSGIEKGRRGEILHGVDHYGKFGKMYHGQ